MRIVVDAFGGDNAPLEIVKGAAIASKKFNVDITLCGNEGIIKKIIEANNLEFFGDFKIVHTDKVIDMSDEPTSIIKENKDSSMGLAFAELSSGNADAFVSAGSTGAIVVGGTLIVKRIKGIKRPALGALIPSPDGFYMMMDMGANAECRPEMLLQFGIMGSAYMENVAGVKNPKVALLNIGTEETKGDELRLESYKLLKESNLNFVGNIESREMPKGVCDVVVTDGFTGNIALKLIEGTAMTLFMMVKGVLMKSIFNKLAAAIIKKDLYKVKKTMDSSEVGGALLLGVQKPVIKAHGSSDAKAIVSAIKQAISIVESDTVGIISNNI